GAAPDHVGRVALGVPAPEFWFQVDHAAVGVVAVEPTRPTLPECRVSEVGFVAQHLADIVRLEESAEAGADAERVEPLGEVEEAHGLGRLPLEDPLRSIELGPVTGRGDPHDLHLLAGAEHHLSVETLGPSVGIFLPSKDAVGRSVLAPTGGRANDL